MKIKLRNKEIIRSLHFLFSNSKWKKFNSSIEWVPLILLDTKFKFLWTDSQLNQAKEEVVNKVLTLMRTMIVGTMRPKFKNKGIYIEIKEEADRVYRRALFLQEHGVCKQVNDLRDAAQKEYLKVVNFETKTLDLMNESLTKLSDFFRIIFNLRYQIDQKYQQRRFDSSL